MMARFYMLTEVSVLNFCFCDFSGKADAIIDLQIWCRSAGP